MSPEFMAVIGAAIALAAVIFSSQRAMRREIGDMRQEMGNMRQEMRQEIAKVQQDIGDLRERMARLEGLFEGFTKTVPGPQPQAAPSPQPQ